MGVNPRELQVYLLMTCWADLNQGHAFPADKDVIEKELRIKADTRTAARRVSPARIFALQPQARKKAWTAYINVPTNSIRLRRF